MFNSVRSVESSSIPVMNKVLVNTYWLLSLTMIPTIIGAFVGLSLNFSWLALHPMLGSVAMLAVMLGLMWVVSANKNNVMGIVALLGFTGVSGVLLGPILQQALHFSNGAQLIGMAAGGTAVIFGSLASYATITKKDFSFIGQFLFIGLILLIVLSLVAMIFPMPLMSLALSGVAVLIFSAYILYDVSRMVNGGERNYIMATMSLYVNIFNLFINLLRILISTSGRN